MIHPPDTAPLVSILMPFRDTGMYLEECLRSIQEQTYSNWELLIVDDHSTDGGPDRVRAFAASDPRIQMLTNPGKGIIPALREAFEASKGEFISRMDSDDIMPPEKLMCMVGDLLEHGAGFVASGQVKYFSIDGISEGYAKYEAWLNQLTRTGTNFQEIYKECSIASPCWMVSRSDLVKCGAFEPDRYPEDYDLTFRFYAKGLQCIPSDQLLHYWRDYPERTSRNHQHYALNYFLDLKLDYFLELDRDDTRPLVLWGAGFKGKSLARQLKEYGVNFRWICDNPNKIGKKIYGIPIEHFELVHELEQPQSIISVAKRGAQRQIRRILEDRHQSAMKDFFFFC